MVFDRMSRSLPIESLGVCLDYIPPNNKGDLDCVEVKGMVFRRNLRLVLCLIFLPIALIISGVLVFKHAQQSNDPQAQQVAIVSDKLAIDQVLPLPTNDKPVTAVSVSNVVKPMVVTVKQSDNLKKIFKRIGLNDNSAMAILSLKQAKVLKNLHAGRKLSLTINPAKTKLQELEYSIDDLNTLVVTAKGSNWSVKTRHIEPTASTKYVTATVNGSIYSTGKKAGVSRKLMAQLVSVFNNKINVNKIRNGDSFALFYKEYTINGRVIRDSEIAAAELTHKGQTHRVVSFTDPHGYTNFYTPDGRSVKPAFVRYPLSFKRIGSRFSLARAHPILHGVVRPHLGVDFTANVGTPIKATSNGKIVFAGHKNGYGKTVMIRQGIYSTLYAHLSRFSSKIFSGKYVKQGEVIGYVGSSGLSTSPHLHYEFCVNDVHRDPLKVKLPTGGEMIASEYRRHFFAQTKKMLAQLDSYRRDPKVFAMYPTSQFNIEEPSQPLQEKRS